MKRKRRRRRTELRRRTPLARGGKHGRPEALGEGKADACGAGDSAAAPQRQALERDGYTCQLCGSHRDLHVHHVRYRSRGGGDGLENLLTLCHRCHAWIHAREIDVRPVQQ